MNGLNRPQTVKELIQWAVLFLGKDKRIEIELLLAKVSGLSRAKLLAYPEIKLSTNEIRDFEDLVNKRHSNIPLQYLLGTQDFMGLEFVVNKSVLIPRSDTEVLVEETLHLAQKTGGSLKILDLCTGSGAIGISLAHYLPEIDVTAVDISPEALDIARANAKRHKVSNRVKFIQGDLFQPIGGEFFHIITSNPPYISSSEMEELPQDVKKEPFLALWGGKDGLDFYRKIIRESVNYLIPSGWLLVEIGWQQGEAVRNLFIEKGFSQCEIIKDWADHDRVVKGCTCIL